VLTPEVPIKILMVKNNSDPLFQSFTKSTQRSAGTNPSPAKDGIATHTQNHFNSMIERTSKRSKDPNNPRQSTDKRMRR